MRILRSVVLAALAASGLYAGPIIITYSGIGSGTMAGTPFTGAVFTITALADTANRVPFSGGFDLPDTSASIAISGLGTFLFTSPTLNFVNNNVVVAGFSDGNTGNDLVYAPSDPGLSSFALLSSFGPIAGTGSLLQWNAVTVTTTGGRLVFDDAQPTVIYQTSLDSQTPEPLSPLLAISGIACLGLLKRRARR